MPCGGLMPLLLPRAKVGGRVYSDFFHISNFIIFFHFQFFTCGISITIITVGLTEYES